MTSDPLNALGLLAQLAISLAGFSSILVTFRRAGDRGDWLPEDSFRFRWMMQATLSASVFSALPHVLAGSFVAGEMPWRALAFTIGLHQAASPFGSRVGWRPVSRGALNPFIFAVFVGGSAASVLLSGSGAAGWLDAANAYLLTIGWMTAFAGLMFYRLVTAPIVDRAD